MEIKHGQLVAIYEHPLTCERFEGNARTVYFLQRDEGLEYWQVRFPHEGALYYRWVNPANCTPRD